MFLNVECSYVTNYTQSVYLPACLLRDFLLFRTTKNCQKVAKLV